MTESVLVSGGSGGIGASLCRELAADGYRPIVGYASSPERAETVAAQTGGSRLFLDLTDSAAIEAAVAELAVATPALVGVVLAASPRPTLARFGRIREDDLLLQWQVHVLGPQRLLAGLLREVLGKRKRGVVIGVLSQAMGDGGSATLSSMGSYVIGKFGLAGLLAALAADHPWLCVDTFSPGFTETPMLEAFDDRFLDMQRTRTPFDRPEDVARCIASRVHELATPSSGTELPA